MPYKIMTIAYTTEESKCCRADINAKSVKQMYWPEFHGFNALLAIAKVQLMIKLQELKLFKWSDQRLRTVCFNRCKEKMSEGKERKRKAAILCMTLPSKRMSLVLYYEL